MKLKTQLLLVSTVLLVLPVAGWRFVVQTEDYLREGQAQAMELTTAAIGNALLAPGNELAEWLPDQPQFYLHPVEVGAVTVDGYPSEWRAWQQDRVIFRDADGEVAVELMAALDRYRLYLMFVIRDSELVFADPYSGLAGEELQVTLFGERGLSTLVVEPDGRGYHRVQLSGQRQRASIAVADLEDQRGGWGLEISLPRSLLVPAASSSSPSGSIAARMAFRFSDRGLRGETVRVIESPQDTPLHLISINQRAGELLTQFRPPGTRAWLLSSDGWIIAHAGEQVRDRSSEQHEVPWLYGLLYRLFLADSMDTVGARRSHGGRLSEHGVGVGTSPRTAVHWVQDGTQSTVITESLFPLYIDGHYRGALLVEKTNDALLLLADNALLGLATTSFAVLIVVLPVILGFAAVLSMRIRRLNRAVASALAADGQLDSGFRPSRRDDELADLSRSFSTLLIELDGYTQYLKSLSSKLSHELKTPLAVVKSSLENLENESLEGDSREYCDRAMGGVERLGKVLRAMSEASRVEASIDGAEKTPVDPVQFLQEYLAAYRALCPSQQIAFDTSLRLGSVSLPAAPELLAQMMDKLLDNACSFATPGSAVSVGLALNDQHLVLWVDNDGPCLPPVMKNRLFDSMVSIRPNSGAAHHLGLGLHIARLIARLHHGEIRARNRDNGVRFEIRLSAHAFK